MKIINQLKEEMSKIEIYQLTRKKGLSIKDCVGSEIKVVNWIVFSNDEKSEIVSVIDDSGVIYRSNSSVFIRSFTDIVENFSRTPTIAVVSGNSKSNRTYVDCELIEL